PGLCNLPNERSVERGIRRSFGVEIHPQEVPLSALEQATPRRGDGRVAGVHPLAVHRNGALFDQPYGLAGGGGERGADQESGEPDPTVFRREALIGGREAQLGDVFGDAVLAVDEIEALGGPRGSICAVVLVDDRRGEVTLRR